MLKKLLSKNERDKILNSLTDEQQEFLINQMKRGKKTVFGNVLANSIAEKNTNESDLIEEIQEWLLVDIIDAGKIDKNTRCECGRSLRYQYILENQKTGDVKKLGISHLQEHLGFPLHIVKEIINGISQVDYELDEILLKVESKWSLTQHGINPLLLDKIELPVDIEKHINLSIPLLEPQLHRLDEMLKQYLLKKEKEKNALPTKHSIAEKANNTKRVVEKLADVEIPFSFDKIPLIQQKFILKYLQNSKNNVSVLQISELLTKYLDLKEEYFYSGKPKNFVEICMFLEALRSHNYCKLISKNFDDRIYSK